MRSTLKTYITLLLLTISVISQAAEIEIGGGVFATSLPKYIGSEEQRTYALPFPYFYYRSDKIQIDRNAFTGFLWHKKSWYLDLSVSGNIPVKSNNTKIRQNMPDIDFVGELGPAIKYYVVGSPSSQRQLSIAFNTRKAFATDLSNLSSVGWHYSTSIAYNMPLTSLFNGALKMNTLFSVNAADDKYLNYYYGVSEQYKTSFRPNYNSQTGYSGSNLSVGLTWKKDSLWVGSFLKYNSLHNSSQQDSPLVTANENLSFGLGLVWVFYKKK